MNLCYFGIEFGVGVRIGSISLFADSVDFLEDASVNFLIAIALRWNTTNRSRVGTALALVILVPFIAALWLAWQKFFEPTAPAAAPLSFVGVGALAVNLSCALLLARFRDKTSSLMRGAFLSARNDVIANVAIIVAGVATVITGSAWPDLIVGLGIVALNATAAREVWSIARKERGSARPNHQDQAHQ